MSPFFEQLPLWLSLGFSVIGIVISIRLAMLAYKGILFVFSLLLTAGVVVFGFHHLLELGDPSYRSLGQILETVSSAIFLAVAVYMFFGLRKILSDR